MDMERTKNSDIIARFDTKNVRGGFRSNFRDEKWADRET